MVKRQDVPLCKDGTWHPINGDNLIEDLKPVLQSSDTGFFIFNQNDLARRGEKKEGCGTFHVTLSYKKKKQISGNDSQSVI